MFLVDERAMWIMTDYRLNIIIFASFYAAAVICTTPDDDIDLSICKKAGISRRLGYLVHPSDCSAYYLCHGGVGKLMHCGLGLHWNTEKDSCDWPYNAKCTLKSQAENDKKKLKVKGWDRRAAHNLKLPNDILSRGWKRHRSPEKFIKSDKVNLSKLKGELEGPCMQERNCSLPACSCATTRPPGALSLKETPQLVMITFDDAVTQYDYDVIFSRLFNNKKNPNGCPISATFFVSHKYTDYVLANKLWTEGHEIASHSISHATPSIAWRAGSKALWKKEIAGERDMLSSYGKIDKKEIRGLRAPYLAINGDVTFAMMKEEGFMYDSSMPTAVNEVTMWPYSMDFGTQHRCTVEPCPKQSYPGIWEIPMNALNGDLGSSCAMVDGCQYPKTKGDALHLFKDNFMRHYKNKIPFLLAFHAGWLRTQKFLEAFEEFLNEIVQKEDIWIVTNYQVLQWVQNPTRLSDLDNFEPFNCNVGYRQGSCTKPNQCRYQVGFDTYYMQTCTEDCPLHYPWVDHPGGEECSLNCEKTDKIKKSERYEELFRRLRG